MTLAFFYVFLHLWTFDTSIAFQVRATLHLVNGEYAALADDFVTLGFLPSGSDSSRVVPALTGVFQKALERGVSNLSFGDLSLNLGKTMYEVRPL